MSVSNFLSAVKARLAALQSGGQAIFSKVEVWDSDSPDTQATALQGATGRFALLLHDLTRYEVEQLGRVQAQTKTVELGVLISNRIWKSGTVPAGLGVLDVVEAVITSLRGRWAEEYTVEVDQAERFRPEPEAGKVAGRIVYRVALKARLRSKEPVSLTR